MSKAVMSKAVMSKAAMSKAAMSKAVMSKAVMSKAVMSKAVMSKAVMSKAVMSKAVMSKAVMSKAVMSKAVMSKAVMAHPRTATSGSAPTHARVERVRYRPLTPDLLVLELAETIDRRAAPRPRIGFDGFEEIGTTALADAVAESLPELGRPVVRVATRWWWRAASLRLELGRTDVDMLLYGWWTPRPAPGAARPGDRRELLDPVTAGSCSTR